MSIRDELSLIRAEPIEVFDADPLSIPCIETSDKDRLCKHPLVSVWMITFNHEAYIREAIEGVIKQQTDFEFELVIGEDCSSDATRDICFEYQKRYPDKVRVLWWHKGVKALANLARTEARLRGDFIAACEGDDYWTDSCKLQKQVDVMRRYPSVSLCFTGTELFFQDSGLFQKWNEGFETFKPGVIKGYDFFSHYVLDEWPCRPKSVLSRYVMTASTLARASSLRACKSKVELLGWQLSLGDKSRWMALSTMGDCYCLPDVTAVYRISCSGVSNNPQIRWQVVRDSNIIRYFFFSTTLGYDLSTYPHDSLFAFVTGQAERLALKTRMQYVRRVLSIPAVRRTIPFAIRPVWAFAVTLGGRCDFMWRVIHRLRTCCLHVKTVDRIMIVERLKQNIESENAR